jgi:hypothetical protein
VCVSQCLFHMVVSVRDMNKPSDGVQQAAERGDLGRLRVLLTSGNVNNLGGGKWAILHWAAYHGRTDCCKFVLESGGDITGRTPLYLASCNDHVEVARALLDAGATVDAITNDGCTSLSLAIFHDYRHVARLLIERGASITNVKLDVKLSSIPDWIHKIITSLSNCRRAALILIGIHRYHRTTITGKNDTNVLRVIGKHIWSCRMDYAWISTGYKVVVGTSKMMQKLKRGNK